MSQAPTVATTTPIISCVDLHYRYPGAEHPTLTGVNLEVMTGENMAIIGPNGGGKTTLLRLLLGLAKPQRGTIKIGGRTPEQARNLIGYVPQYALFDRDFPLTVEQAVLQGRLGLGRAFYNRGDRDQVAAVLAQVGLATMARKPIASLSGGQMQRALIARALVVDPQILLLDEPTASVDPHAEDDLFELLARQLGHLTMIVVTHDLTFVGQDISRVGCLNRNLEIHQTAKLDADALARLYGGDSRLVDHHHDHHQQHQHHHQGPTDPGGQR